MIVIDNLEQVASQIESERGIAKEALYEAIEQALISACKKRYDEESTVEAKLDVKANQLFLYFIKTVVDDVSYPYQEISVKDAQEFQEKAKINDLIQIPLVDPAFGRYAAQVARQVIIQRLREEEKGIVYDYFKAKEGKIVTATVQSVDKNSYLLNLGKTEAVLPFRDCIPLQNFSVKEVIKVFIVSVDNTGRRPVIRLSRSHPGFLQQMLYQEIPEIQDGIIEIKSVSRQAGERSKVAVFSNNSAIGAVGTCVGPMGGRIQNIIEEIGNKERIDVLEWNENIKEFIAASLKPAKISRVIFLDETEKKALVVTENEQLSLAIGKQGQNIRLASRLTGWHLDVTDEHNLNNKIEELGVEISASTLAEKMENNQSDDEKTPVSSLSLAEKMRLSKKDDVDERALKKPPVIKATCSVLDLANLLGFTTAAELIREIKGRVEIPSEDAELDPDTVTKIKGLFS